MRGSLIGIPPLGCIQVLAGQMGFGQSPSQKGKWIKWILVKIPLIEKEAISNIFIKQRCTKVYHRDIFGHFSLRSPRFSAMPNWKEKKGRQTDEAKLGGQTWRLNSQERRWHLLPPPGQLSPTGKGKVSECRPHEVSKLGA